MTGTDTRIHGIYQHHHARLWKIRHTSVHVRASLRDNQRGQRAERKTTTEGAP